MKALPQNDSSYKVCINKRYGTLTADTCRIQVSIGNPKYEGEKFASLMEWAERRYTSVQLIVSDTLQRHNFKMPNDNALAVSRQEGVNWLERNRGCIVNAQITRWDELLNNDYYHTAKQRIDTHFTGNQDVKDEILCTAERFSLRNGSSVEGSVDFLLEELAVFAILFQKPAVDVYAGSWISNIFDPLSKSMPVFTVIRCLQVDFERRKTDYKMAA